MRILNTDLPSVLLIEPDVFRDPRGHFLETFHERKYREAGIPHPFVQDNQSRSNRGTLPPSSLKYLEAEDTKKAAGMRAGIAIRHTAKDLRILKARIGISCFKQMGYVLYCGPHNEFHNCNPSVTMLSMEIN